MKTPTAQQISTPFDAKFARRKPPQTRAEVNRTRARAKAGSRSR
jgi:hypothetical protein